MLGLLLRTREMTVYEAKEPFVSRQELVEHLLKFLDAYLPPGGEVRGFAQDSFPCVVIYRMPRGARSEG